jgi:predicted phosphoadenosine phosphosulfate sulfurtransferase
VKEVAQHPRVKMWWMCLPVKYYNGCSTQQQEWYTWNPEKRDRWVREMPVEFCENTENCELVTLDHPRVSDESIGGPVFEKGETRHKDLNKIMFDRWTKSDETDVDYGTIANLTGVRTAESLTRLRGVLQGGWIAEKSSTMHYLKPIYDWKDHDLWLAHDKKDWPYNAAYDKLAQAGVPRSEWRTAQPFGPEPLRGLDYFKRCWPDLWDRCMHRVPGATAADEWGYQLYEARRREGETWQDAAVRYWRNVRDEDKREEMKQKIQSVLDGHRSHATRALPLKKNCPYCEWSWQRIASNNARGIRKWRKGDA